MRHAPRHFAERPQPLGLELLVARHVERRGQVAQRLAQRLEFRRPPRRHARGQGLAHADQLRPAHQLVDRPRQLPRQVPREPHRGEQHQRAQRHDHDRETGRVIAQVRLAAARQARRVGDALQMIAQGGPACRCELHRVHALHESAGRRDDVFEGGARPG
ncbi:MAG: hypothetical protein AUJ00_00720 [Gemmatimonadetes bacterium 13_1_40CM_3_70_6]|nr:MAG: hypothetical protein AUJ00_00720 [Gemmatimonadetes bacterium 13_1_40CM_3_70_6]